MAVSGEVAVLLAVPECRTNFGNNRVMPAVLTAGAK